MKAARRARARTAALQSLYELEARPMGVEVAIEDLTDHFTPPPMDIVYHRQLVVSRQIPRHLDIGASHLGKPSEKRLRPAAADLC